MRMPKVYYSIPDRLIVATRERRLVPFVGSGFSKQAGADKYPSWTELLLTMLRDAKRRGEVDAITERHIKSMIHKGQHLMAAEALKSRMATDAFATLMEESFAPQNVTPSHAHRTLLLLNPRMIVTTNYDRLIENTYAEIKRQAMTVITYDESAKAQRRLQDDKERERTFLYKIHGDVEDISSLILSETDYRRLLYDSAGYNAVLGSVFIHFVVVFMGFSLSDPELLLTLGRMRHALKSQNTPDYVIVPDDNINAVQIERYREDFGVETILYVSDLIHSGIVRFLRKLHLKAFGTGRRTP
ncbi:SIR2 family protein [Candidatus Peregrinibacteria bacterium]|nr:SIR2 family protein [Candidatus Peregrinibacteria bacterium]